MAELPGQAAGPDERAPVHDHASTYSRAEGEHRHAPLVGTGGPELAQGGGIAVVLDDDREPETATEIGSERVVPGVEVGPPDQVLAVSRQPPRHRQAHGGDLAPEPRRHGLALGDGGFEGGHERG